MFANIQENIHKVVIDKFNNDEAAFAKSEHTLLFFDYICCPFLEERKKIELMKVSKYFLINSPNNEIIAKMNDVHVREHTQ